MTVRFAGLFRELPSLPEHPLEPAAAAVALSAQPIAAEATQTVTGQHDAGSRQDVMSRRLQNISGVVSTILSGDHGFAAWIMLLTVAARDPLLEVIRPTGKPGLYEIQGSIYRVLAQFYDQHYLSVHELSNLYVQCLDPSEESARIRYHRALARVPVGAPLSRQVLDQWDVMYQQGRSISSPPCLGQYMRRFVKTFESESQAAFAWVELPPVFTGTLLTCLRLCGPSPGLSLSSTMLAFIRPLHWRPQKEAVFIPDLRIQIGSNRYRLRGVIMLEQFPEETLPGTHSPREALKGYHTYFFPETGPLCVYITRNVGTDSPSWKQLNITVEDYGAYIQSCHLEAAAPIDSQIVRLVQSMGSHGELFLYEKEPANS